MIFRFRTTLNDVVKTIWQIIIFYRLEIQLFLLIGLTFLLLYLIKRRRSKTLSFLVKKEFIDYKKKLYKPISAIELFSTAKFIILAFILPVLIILIYGLIQTRIYDYQNAHSDIERFLSTLHTSGAIVASFTAILVTIIIFSVTVNSAYIISVSSLFKFYLKKLFFKPVLSFAAGTVVATLLNSILINHFMSWPLNTVYLIVILGCFVIVLDLSLLFIAIELLVRSKIGVLLGENYVQEHRISLLAHIKRTLAQNLFVKLTKNIGFQFDLYDLHKNKQHSEYFIFKPGSFINEVNFGQIEKISKRWKDKLPVGIDKRNTNAISDNIANMNIWPGEQLPKKEEKWKAMSILGMQHDLKIQKLIKSAFTCSKKNRWQVAVVEWSEISDLLRSLIEKKDIACFKNVLESFYTIVEDYLEARRSIGWPHKIQTFDEEIFSPYRAPTLLNLDFHGFLRFAIKNEDEECLDEIGGFLYRMARTSFELESEQYFDEVLVRLNWIYELSRGSERLNKSASSFIIRRYKNVANIFSYYKYDDEKNPEVYNYICPFIVKFLKNILEALKSAARHSDNKTFQELLKVTDSLLEHRIDRDIRTQYFYNYRHQEAALLESKLNILDLIHLSNLIIAAWLYRGVKEEEYKKEVIRPLINLALNKILDYNILIEVYLLAQSNRHHRSILSYDFWDVVPNQITEGDAFSNWIQAFWIVIALRRSISKPIKNIKRIRPLSSINSFDCQTLSSNIDNVVNNEDHEWLTATKDLNKGKTYLLGIFGALAYRQSKEDYKNIIESQIDNETQKVFTQNIIKSYINSAKFQNFLNYYKKQDNNVIASAVEQLPDYCCGYVDKEVLIPGGHDSGLSRIYGERACNRENVHFSYLLEQSFNIKEAIGGFDELPDKIRNIAAQLRTKGFNPQTVIIPSDYRYEKVLSDTERLHRRCPLGISPVLRWITTFDNMEVFSWPHIDSECVAVLDIGSYVRFSNSQGDNSRLLDISFRKINSDELNRLLTSKAKEYGRKEFKKWLRSLDYDINKVSEIKRVVVIKYNMQLELLNLHAGTKLLPDEEKMGMIYREGEKIYHLPDCNLVQHIPASERRYILNLGLAELKYQKEGYLPCDICHPDYE